MCQGPIERHYNKQYLMSINRHMFIFLFTMEVHWLLKWFMKANENGLEFVREMVTVRHIESPGQGQK